MFVNLYVLWGQKAPVKELFNLSEAFFCLSKALDFIKTNRDIYTQIN